MSVTQIMIVIYKKKSGWKYIFLSLNHISVIHGDSVSTKHHVDLNVVNLKFVTIFVFLSLF